MKRLTIAKAKELGYFPDQLKPYLQETCEFCESSLLIAINDSGEPTKRCCSYEYCPGHLQYRMDAVCKKLSIKGIGPATCLSYIKQYKLKLPHEIVPILTKEKPPLDLWQIADLMQISGFSSKLEDLMAGYFSFKEFFNKAVNIPFELRERKDDLIKVESFFTIKPPLSSNKILVSITGSIPGYRNRDLFIDKCNQVVGHKFRIVLRGASQKNQFVITQNKNSDTPKMQAARKSRVTQIVTPDEFLLFLIKLFEETTYISDKEG